MRLAKAYELDHELMNLALKSTPSVMINAAEYLDEKVGAVLSIFEGSRHTIDEF